MPPEITTVFFADVLGFSARSRSTDAQGAVDALSDLASVLSHHDQVARYLNREAPWDRRYGLSDSLLLTSPDTAAAASAAAELFFNLAYYNSTEAAPVMIRGALSYGRVRELAPLFPESASGNLAGSAVVEAVELEKQGGRGPRLFTTPPVAARLDRTPVGWLLDQPAPGVFELLWILPVDRQEITAQQDLVADVCRAAVDLFVGQASDPAATPHALAYLDLATRALGRLREVDPDGTRYILAAAELDRAVPLLDGLARARHLPELATLERVRSLGG